MSDKILNDNDAWPLKMVTVWCYLEEQWWLGPTGKVLSMKALDNTLYQSSVIFKTHQLSSVDPG